MPRSRQQIIHNPHTRQPAPFHKHHLRQLLVEAPEDLDDVEGGRGDRVGEVSAGRRDGADDGDAAVPDRLGAGAGHLARALVEGRRRSPCPRARRRRPARPVGD